METEQSALLNTPSAPLWIRLLVALRKPPVLLATLALLLLGWQLLETRLLLADLRQELAGRLAESGALSRQNQEMLQALSAKTAVLEAREAEAQGRQMALESMYHELSRSRDERVLAEIEQTVAIAAQQLQLTGNVDAVVTALQGIDARLTRAGQGRLLQLRKLINRDIDRLKALPLADVPGIALKLESVIGATDTLPLAFERRVRVEPAAKPRNTPNAAAKPVAGIFGDGFWRGLGADLWAEVKQLIRVERIDRPEPALLAPAQAFFLRENLKLRLLDARLALLQRDGRTFREDARQARELLERYFDIREKSVGNAIAMLKGLSGADLSLEPPSLGELLGSIRNFKLALDKDSPAEIPRQKGATNGISRGPATAEATR